ncbi:MAG: NAD(P)/FAD-dependent oxidoreductase [Hoeflea sp.]|uniref:NAD(P)/FAD-dependent oxidoreductase n=1 Tax=Hoeflea sp. TaxID=1940281 RepID=UPI001DF07595|nr:NAD(P)/FAD-dependent oxidoreductase [Hoeflea sp.]MBU4531958.1 NAD(P)/FAD-dependent oxidoreductase [Alphaproteobacteria bacterium]MBU4546380.1 NAD(P)/FAD-dependent oxidoreductase [Alphaproteobacteria bacterium]MBU4549509.1 NAD(P)/FAD-dependent oxidoreductase [Alphaproteobacteria bacterium]MBV1722684.1 NAD(P)/FAD-dependent oxidoreductase [Hoeflea sp.]MBV1782623.1 NAD(P)/FAD-dependent oxidoreductase [Hoeflea sp.]
MMDVAIIGGSFAGLTAALQLGRASRSVLVLDAGAPRNRTSPGAHGVAGWDGVPPAEILARFRADLAPYKSVSLHKAVVTGASGNEDAFTLTLADNERVFARRIVLAHGVRDILPDIPGLTDAWGKRVLHCPYCHGYEVKGGSLVVLAVHPMSAHQALMLRADWSRQVTLLTAGMEGVDHEALEQAGVRVDHRGLQAVTEVSDGIDITLTDGSIERHAALFLGPKTSLAGSPAEHLGCMLGEGPMGPFVRVGPMAQTSIAGVFAAGDIARPMPNINFALADGFQAGSGCHASLLFPGLIQPLVEVSAP